ncbi:hypothetical protein GCM10022404_23890 [Celeribacter arenosi]|uniref:Secreted protein n=1 Tax=Celeribacter arenosi TaxID=792649 RepID=A0ABP7KFH5_9RHOB
MESVGTPHKSNTGHATAKAQMCGVILIVCCASGDTGTKPTMGNRTPIATERCDGIRQPDVSNCQDQFGFQVRRKQPHNSRVIKLTHVASTKFTFDNRV